MGNGYCARVQEDKEIRPWDGAPLFPRELRNDNRGKTRKKKMGKNRQKKEHPRCGLARCLEGGRGNLGRLQYRSGAK